MADVSVTFDGDLRELNRQIVDLQKTGERAGKAINKPMEQLLERDKRVENSLGNLARGFALAQTPAEGLVSVLDNLERSFRTPLFVGAAAAIGVALNQAFESAARGANAFSATVENILGKSPLDATIEDVDRLRDQLHAMSLDAADDNLFEKWIFGGQKDQQLESVRQALEEAAGFATQARNRALGFSLSDSKSATSAAFARADAASVRFGEFSGRTGDAEWIDQQRKHAQELRQAEEQLKKARQKGSLDEIELQRELVAEVMRRHDFENKALDQTIAKERYRGELARDLQALETRHQYELMGLYSDREKLELQIEQAAEKAALVSANRGATEKEINGALVDQAKLKFQLVELASKEADSLAAGQRSRLERTALGKSDLDQQRLITRMAEQEARGANELAKTADERQKAEELLTNSAKERVKLMQMEREEAKRIRDIEFERSQLQNTTDPFGRAQSALAHARQEATITSVRSDSSQSERDAATLEVLRSLQALLEAAKEAGPSVQAIAMATPSELNSLRQQAFAPAPNDPARAQQSLARTQYADMLRATDPYGTATRARTDRLRRQADIRGLQAQDVLPDTMDSREAKRLANLDKQDFADEMGARQLAKEESARRKDAERQSKREESGIDAWKKMQEKPGEAVPPGAEPKAKEEPKADPMATIASAVQNIDKNVESVEKKLPQRALK